MSLEPVLEATENGLEGKSERERNSRLFQSLELVLAMAEKRLNDHNNPDEKKQAWARILIQTVKAYGDLYKLQDLERLQQQIDAINERLTR